MVTLKLRACFAALLLISATALAPAASAQSTANVPPSLLPWVPWVLEGHELRACPFALSDQRGTAQPIFCIWPGELNVSVDGERARFTVPLTVLADSVVALPGDARMRPRDVTVDGRPAAVLFNEGIPAVRLEAGSHRIAGELRWSKRPPQLPVPDDFALVTLTLDGAPVPVPERENGQLWLGRAVAQVEAESLNVKVFRQLTDGLPLLLSTRIELEVSGRAREVTLGPALPDGFEPLAIQSPLPAGLDAAGNLRVQLRPGTWSVALDARALHVLDAISSPQAAAPWPEQEIWGWQTQPSLRVAELEGGSPVDPNQVGAQWGGSLPTFVLSSGETLTISERSRGRDLEAPHRLRLQRELWLQFDGEGVIARDQLSGRMAAAERLNVAAPWELKRASDGEDTLLVTRSEDGQVGVELRQLDLDLTTTGRHPGRGAMPASGWSHDFESVSASLNLPPGWRLLFAGGVDEAPQSWLAQWTLLDMFLLAFAALLAYRLVGVGFAALVLGYLAIGYHEADSPLWSLLAVMALGLLLTVLAIGKLSTVLRWLRASLLALAAILTLLFATTQLQLALHPQLERDAVQSASSDYGGYSSYGRVSKGGNVAMEGMSVVLDDFTPVSTPAPPPPMPSSAPQRAGSELDQIQVTGNRVKSKVRNNNQYPDDAILQAGPGTPDWRWQRVSLSWSGPVLVDQQMNLWLSPPWLTRLLRIAVVVLLVLVLIRLARGTLPSRTGKSTSASPAAALLGPSLLAMSLLGSGLMLASPNASAQNFPSEELLTELRERLLKAPDCAPQCASLDRAEVQLDGNRLRLALVLHAEAEVAIPLPDMGRAAAPISVQLGGSDVKLKGVQGQRWLLLPRGVQRAEVTWQLTAVDQLGLRFPMPPGAVVARGEGWEFGGLEGERLLGDTLQILRLANEVGSEGEGARAIQGESFAPFVEVTRRVSLDLDWTVETSVQRRAPAQSGFEISLPLLPGERLLDDTLDVKDGKVKLNFAAGEQNISWSSRLPLGDQLTLSMGPLTAWSETWWVSVGGFWHAGFSGVPETLSGSSTPIRRFDPRPDEVLTIELSRPEAVAGASLALDQVTLSQTLGARATDASLSATLRSTRGGQHVLSIPVDAELISSSINGRELNLRPEDGTLRIPVVPGEQSLQLQWRRVDDGGFRQTSDAVDLGAEAANIRTQMRFGADRWILFAGGAGVGPAVLYWGQLLVMILAAAGLARVSGSTPLRFHHWLLLGLGFSTVSWLAALAVVGWLLLLGWRQRYAGAIVSHTAFPLVQLLLLLVSICALLVLIAAVPYGLLGTPDMQIAGNGSSSFQLNWFLDRSEGPMPTVWAITLPMWAYKLAILLWSLWLANALIGWLRWGWKSVSSGGYWPPPKAKVKAPPIPAATVPAQQTPTPTMESKGSGG